MKEIINPVLLPNSDWTMPEEFPDLSAYKLISVDLETKDRFIKTKGPGWCFPSARRMEDYIVGVAIAADYKSWYFPVRHKQGPNLDPKVVFRWLKPYMEDPTVDKIAFNALYEMGWLSVEGINIQGTIHDPGIAAALLDEHRRFYNLDSLGHDWLGRKKDQTMLRQAALAFGFGSDDNEVKANLWRLPAMYVGPYAEMDAVLNIELYNHVIQRIYAEGLGDVYQLELDQLKPLFEMRKRGVRVDVAKAKALGDVLESREKSNLDKLTEITGQAIDIWSNKSLSLAYDSLKLVYPRTEKGNASFTGDWLDEQTDPISSLIKECRKLNRARSTFSSGLITDFATEEGRIHCQFHQLKNDEYGTVGGRYSCVAGWTPVVTINGERSIEDIRPGDLVLSHTGAWRKVTAKIIKGIDEMFDVRFCNGDTLTCTNDHRLLLSDGSWKSLRDIQKEGYAHVNLKGMDKQTGMDQGSFGAVSSARVPKDQGHCFGDANDRAQCTACSKNTPTLARVFGDEEDQAFHCKDGGQKSDEGSKWFSAPQLCRLMRRWLRIFDSKDWKCAEVCASASYGRGSWTKGPSEKVLCAPHRRRQEEQLIGQPCPVHQYGAQCIARPSKRSVHEVTIKEINPVGRRTVHDISVEVDHSYAACGVFSHNSSGPNLQQIPARDPEVGPLVRGLFLPEEGGMWGKFDYSQQEPRLTVHYAYLFHMGGSDEAMKYYRDNPDADYHQMVADMTGLSRKHAKTINLGLAYGMGKEKLRDSLGVDADRAKEIFDQYHSRVPFVKELSYKCSDVASQRGLIRTILGRRCRFPKWEAVDRGINESMGALDSRDEALFYVKQKIEEAQKALQSYLQRKAWTLTPPEAKPTLPKFGVRRALTYRGMNRLIQGSAADMTKLAVVNLYKAGYCPQLMVHDECDMTVYSRKECEAIKEIMRDAIKLTVPVRVDGEVGPSWGEVSKEWPWAQ